MIALLTPTVAGNLTILHDSITGRVEIESKGDVPGITYLFLHPKLFEMLGFSVNQLSVVSATESVLNVGDSSMVEASRTPAFGTTPIVHVLARKAASQNMLSSNSTEYSVLASVAMSGAAYGEYATYLAPDIFVDDIDFKSPRELSDVDFEIVDHEFNPVIIDPRFPVVIQLKVFHTDTKK
tara:strand:+ start:641 stop:1183 length:543 start_codon:yes stop_codon:yes gene_type:complete